MCCVCVFVCVAQDLILWAVTDSQTPGGGALAWFSNMLHVSPWTLTPQRLSSCHTTAGSILETRSAEILLHGNHFVLLTWPPYATVRWMDVNAKHIITFLLDRAGVEFSVLSFWTKCCIFKSASVFQNVKICSSHPNALKIICFIYLIC